MEPNHVIRELIALSEAIQRAKKPSAVKVAARIREILAAMEPINPHVMAVTDMIVDYAKKNKLTMVSRSNILALVEDMFAV
jgi:hypothetical protein